MTPTTTSRARRILSRVNATWSELDYAQRRLFELRTGTTGLTGQHDHRPHRHQGQPGAHH